ncbi:hypothetical protein PG985_010444 [Apiospora marii]|uniref:Uncharacterized protein n=1 Tax=Apiospora marii TaxID=335849 RepID=A0ABR1RZ96_9PEZI
MRSLSTLLLLLAVNPGECFPSLVKDRDDKISPPQSPSESEAIPLAPAPLPDSDSSTKTPSSCNYGWPTLLAPIVAISRAPTRRPTVQSRHHQLGRIQRPPRRHTFIYGTSSACRDVATAVQWILDACTVEGEVAGQSPAFRNGDLIVVVQQGIYLNLTA